MWMRGFADELTKIAFDEAQAMRVAGLAKKIQLPGAAARTMSTAMGRAMGMPGMKVPVPLAAVAPTRTAIAGGLNTVSKVTRATPAEMPALRTGFHKAFKEQGGDALSGQMGGHIVQAPRAIGKLRGIAKKGLGKNLPTLDPSQNRMMQGVLKGHELDELRVRPNAATAPFQHLSPDVIYREHNRLATMPQGYEPVRSSMQQLRAGREAEALFPKQIQYGAPGQRLSRHARRHLSEISERKMMNTVPHEVRNQVRAQVGLPEMASPVRTTVEELPRQQAESMIRQRTGGGLKAKLTKNPFRDMVARIKARRLSSGG
jgi:hypothetical protein